MSEWPTLDGKPSAEKMVFISEPPDAIGEVVGAWTNHRENGPPLAPLSARLLGPGLGAMGGFVLGLVGFFVIGGVLEGGGTRVSGDLFLGLLAGGVVVGGLVGSFWFFRPPSTLTLYVGTRGCAQIQLRDGRIVAEECLLFAEVATINTRISSMSVQGIRTTACEYYVSDQHGKKRLWFVSNTKPADPFDAQYHFGQAVLKAFETHTNN